VTTSELARGPRSKEVEEVERDVHEHATVMAWPSAQI